MKPQSDVEVQYADLVASHDDLAAARKSPVKVRRAFSRFVDLTQELTAAMRREFKARTGLDWQASDFPGWNSVTDLFQEPPSDWTARATDSDSGRGDSVFQTFR